MLQQVWHWQGFLCLDKEFQVTIEFCQDQEFLCRDRVFLCRDIIWPSMGFLCRGRVFLRRDRVWPRHGILGSNKVFSYRNRVWGKGQGQDSLRRDKEFDVATELLEIVSQ